MSYEKFGHFASGMASVVTSIAIISGGLFAYYKFEVIERRDASANYAVKSGEARAQLSVDTDLTISPLYPDENSLSQWQKYTEIVYSGYCDDDSGELTITQEIKEICEGSSPEISVLAKTTSACASSDLLPVFLGWNAYLVVSIENQSTVPLRYTVDEIHLDIAPDPRLMSEQMLKEIESGLAIPRLEAVDFPAALHQRLSAADVALAQPSSEVGIGYTNSVGFAFNFYVPFECNEAEKLVKIKALGDVEQIEKIGTNSLYQKTNRELTFLCRLPRDGSGGYDPELNCDGAALRIYSQ